MELLNNKSILSNELVQKMGIHIANISMLESPNIIKMGNCNFLQPDDLFLPKNIKQFIKSNINSFTNLENMLPCKFARDELEVSEKHLLQSGIVEKIVEVSGKQFYKFNADFVKRIHKKVLYVLDKEEFEDCLKTKSITDYIELSKNKYLTMY